MFKWRTTELYLILGATPVLALIFVMSAITAGSDLTLEAFAVPIGLFVAFVGSHFVICKLAPNSDNAILPITYALSGIGIAFVFRLAPKLAVNQLMWLFAGIALMLITLVMVRSISELARYKYTIMIFGILLMLLPAAVGVEHYGSKIWISIGGMSFQPGEIAKILIVLFLAAYMADNREMLSVSQRKVGKIYIPDFKTLFPLLFMLGITLLIVVFEKDLGSALLFFGLFLVMIYVCTGRISYVIISLLLLSLAAVALYFTMAHVRSRVNIWINPFDYAQDQGYQLVQALYSMADGGLFGTGIGRGMPTTIPVVESDFIFAAMAEEMGLLGASAVLLLFLLFCIRGFATAARARRDVDAFAAVGLTASISFQAFVIVGGVTGLIPLTGVTLPFMSQGGSSLIASFIVVGLLLRTGDDGTGIGTEITMVSRGLNSTGALGRVALGKRLTRILIVFSILFALLIANLTNVMIVRADTIQQMPSNNHTLSKNEKIQRGSIVTSDGVVLAKSVQQSDGYYAREYPQGDLASHVVGYYSTRYGTSGIESSQNVTLTGNKDFSTLSGAVTSLSGGSNPGNDVTLTINSTIQRAAQNALGDKAGAVVVTDPTTGEVLALASSPTYNLEDIDQYLSGSSNSDALFNRATQGLYTPGSTFKTVTLAGAIDQEIATLDTTYSSPGSIEIGGGKITSANESSLGNVSLARAFAYSSNVVFAQVGDEMGSENLVNAAKAFGFNTAIDTDFGIAKSLMPEPSEMTQWETAWSAVGQPVGEHASPAGPQATVTEMSMVASAIANNGTVMTPHVVKNISSPQGAIMSTTNSSILSQACSANAAEQVKEAMRQCVEYGTGQAAAIEGADVYGKTGTAQTSATTDNSWFIGTAEANGKNVSIAIVVEDTSDATTGRAAEILRTSLQTLGAL